MASLGRDRRGSEWQRERGSVEAVEPGDEMNVEVVAAGVAADELRDDGDEGGEQNQSRTPDLEPPVFGCSAVALRNRCHANRENARRPVEQTPFAS